MRPLSSQARSGLQQGSPCFSGVLVTGLPQPLRAHVRAFVGRAAAEPPDALRPEPLNVLNIELPALLERERQRPPGAPRHDAAWQVVHLQPSFFGRSMQTSIMP